MAGLNLAIKRLRLKKMPKTHRQNLKKSTLCHSIYKIPIIHKITYEV